MKWHVVNFLYNFEAKYFFSIFYNQTINFSLELLSEADAAADSLSNTQREMETAGEMRCGGQCRLYILYS